LLHFFVDLCNSFTPLKYWILALLHFFVKMAQKWPKTNRPKRAREARPGDVLEAVAVVEAARVTGSDWEANTTNGGTAKGGNPKDRQEPVTTGGSRTGSDAEDKQAATSAGRFEAKMRGKRLTASTRRATVEALRTTGRDTG
jgi:hypothetical protein